jgi:hypothetical protein
MKEYLHINVPSEVNKKADPLLAKKIVETIMETLRPHMNAPNEDIGTTYSTVERMKETLDGIIKNDNSKWSEEEVAYCKEVFIEIDKYLDRYSNLKAFW